MATLAIASVQTPADQAPSDETFLTGLLLETEKKVRESVNKKQQVAKPIASPKVYGTSPLFIRLKKIVRKVWHAILLTRFLMRVLKNRIQSGWEYDPDARLFRKRPVINLGVGKNISAVNFSVLHLFNTQKTFQGWMNESMRELFRKRPGTRNEADLMEMQIWCSGMKAFKKYQPHVQKTILQMGRYERWHAGRVIVKEGQKPMNFYVILDGEVEVSQIDWFV